MKKYSHIPYMTIIAIVMWISITNTIQAFKCPEMTKTELVLRIPDSFKLNFQNCIINTK